MQSFEQNDFKLDTNHLRTTPGYEQAAAVVSRSWCASKETRTINKYE